MMMIMKIQGLRMTQRVGEVLQELSRLRVMVDGVWVAMVVEGRGRSPENKKSENIKRKINIKGDLQGQSEFLSSQKEGKDRGFPMKQQSKGLNKNLVRYEENKK